ncbi:RNA polymerase sigma factor [Sunxiuqinia sp. A32]|uniref:RNA polymerase sigma factor n=1 Tax=Sunxiuqinia sp. A32 TaxID=3461496 RepID=UPI004045E1DD
MKALNSADIEVWKRFKNGENEALSLIYSENSRKLYSFGLKITSNRSIIEDSIQDLFCDLVKNRSNLGDPDNILSYLIQSFKRRLLRQLNKENRYSLNNNDEDYIFDIAYSIEHDIILEEKSNRKVILLGRAVTKLTPRQKEAIYLKFTERLEYGQIAEIMDMSIEGCRNLTYRAIKSLKDSIQSNGSLLFLVWRKFKSIKKY